MRETLMHTDILQDKKIVLNISQMDNSSNSTKSCVRCRIPQRERTSSRSSIEPVNRFPRQSTVPQPKQVIRMADRYRPAPPANRRVVKTECCSTEPVITVAVQDSLKKMTADAEQCTAVADTPHLTKSDTVMKLDNELKINMATYESVKNAISKNKATLAATYSAIKNLSLMLTSLGHETNLPALIDPQAIEQNNEIFWKMKVHADAAEQKLRDAMLSKNLSVDLNRLYSTPSKLLANCEEILVMRKDLFNWFESLINSQSVQLQEEHLDRLNDYHNQNEKMYNILDQLKAEFNEYMDDISDFLKQGIKNNIHLQVRNEELTNIISELDSANEALRKQSQKPPGPSYKIRKPRNEELLENEVKELKRQKSMYRDQFYKCEKQHRIVQTELTRYKAELSQKSLHIEALEKALRNLQSQNQNMQDDFNKELTKLTLLIKEHTEDLENIAQTRQKLEKEKNKIEKELEELAIVHENVLLKGEQDTKNFESKIAEIEKKYSDLLEQNASLQEKIAELNKATVCVEDLKKELENKEQLLQQQHNLEIKVTEEIEILKFEMNNWIKQHDEKCETINNLEMSLEDYAKNEECLKQDIDTKDKIIASLKTDIINLEQTLKESENRLASYVTEMTEVKNNVLQLKEKYGDIEDVQSLCEKIKVQQQELIELNNVNKELSDNLQKKEIELSTLSESQKANLQKLQEKDDLLKFLTEKEQGQAYIIKILRNSLESGVTRENELSQQLSTRDLEIQSLNVIIDNKKQQLQVLEKIILTLEDQTRAEHQQRQNNLEKISAMEKQIENFQCYTHAPPSVDMPIDNLDSLIKILEKELQQPSVRTTTNRKKKSLQQSDSELDNMSNEINNKEMYADSKHTKKKPGTHPLSPCGDKKSDNVFITLDSYRELKKFYNGEKIQKMFKLAGHKL